MQTFHVLGLSVRKLKRLVAAGLVSGIDGAKLEQWLAEAFAPAAGGRRSMIELRRRRRLERAFAKACGQLQHQLDEPRAREFLALRVIAYLRYLFVHLRSCLLGAVATGLLLLGAVTLYAFEPKQFVSLALWISIAIAVAVTFWIFLQTDRNATLSRIGNTDPGKVSFDKTFALNLVLYVAVPVLGLVASKFPELGRLLGRVADSVLHVAGGG